MAYDCRLDHVSQGHVIRINYGRYRRGVYLRERLSQWLGTEPALEHETKEALRRGTDEFYRLASPPRARAEDGGPRLSKSEIRKIITLSGLSTRRYLEKWLTIRCFIDGRRRIAPAPDVYSSVSASLNEMSRCWDTDVSVRLGRDNIPSINFLFRVALLRHSMAAYLTHRTQFPLDNKKARTVTRLWGYYVELCRSLNWLVFVPLYCTAPRNVVVAGRRMPRAAPKRHLIALPGSRAQRKRKR